MAKVLLFLSAILFTSLANAEAFKCSDAAGRVKYQAKPCTVVESDTGKTKIQLKNPEKNPQYEQNRQQLEAKAAEKRSNDERIAKEEFEAINKVAQTNIAAQQLEAQRRTALAEEAQARKPPVVVIMGR